MNPIRRKLKVISNKKIAREHYLLELELNEKVELAPGQFLQLSLEGKGQFLRRPFSIFDCEDGVLKILYKLRGQITSYMAELKKTDIVDVIFPLGSYFPILNQGEITLVSGGTGFAPLHFLAKKIIKEQNLKIKFIIGTKGKEADVFKNFLPSDIETEIVTEDGTVGKKGVVTDLVSNFKGCVYSAGPLEMLKRIYAKIKDGENPAYFSFESHFACGLGFCWGCVLPTKEGLLRVCKEGPVFNPHIVKWEKI